MMPMASSPICCSNDSSIAVIPPRIGVLPPYSAAGGERAGFHGEEADLHRSALGAQDRGRGNERARSEHALQDGAALDGHGSSLRLRLRGRVSPVACFPSSWISSLHT